jgi:hypothetical protein
LEKEIEVLREENTNLARLREKDRAAVFDAERTTGDL